MGRTLLHRCTGCHEYTLQETCPRCGGKAAPNKPAKFSPEDHYGEYRRRLKQMERDAAGQAGSNGADGKDPAGDT